jgi:hypothetical protein
MPTALYDIYNENQNKNLVIVVSIEGIEYKFSNRKIATVPVIGQPGLYIGATGFYVGEPYPDASVLDVISLQRSSLSINQKLEPEQGKASVSTMTLGLVDLNGFITELCSPTPSFDIEGANAIVHMGFWETQYPGDYTVIFRGVVSSVTSQTGMIMLQLSDPNVKKRQNIFYCASTTTTTPINGTTYLTTVTIPVVSTGSFPAYILGPDGNYDSSVHIFIKIDDEYMYLAPADNPQTNNILNDPTNFYVRRVGNAGYIDPQVPLSTGEPNFIAAHDSDSDVYAYIKLEGHAIDLALKLMLSGWQGDCESGIEISSFVDITGIGAVANAIEFPQNTDVVRDYGLAVGDYITVTGAVNGANNVVGAVVEAIYDLDSDNTGRYILISGGTLVSETPLVAVMSIRSQYDTLPDVCGLQMSVNDVDVAGHVSLKDEYLSSSENSYRFFLSAAEAGKQFIETEVYFPISTYSITRQGRCGIKMTIPPLGTAELITLDESNIVHPEQIQCIRATNNRTFYNEVDYQYDADDTGTFRSVNDFIDDAALIQIGLSSVLPVNSRGIRSDLSAGIINTLQERANALLTRYSKCAVKISLSVMWGVANKIEAGDIIALDGDNLSISNFQNGTRNFGVQLMEVVDRTLNISTGQAQLVLLGGVGAAVTDRFATIAPSSVVGSGSSTSGIIIVESFTAANPLFPTNEGNKWVQLSDEHIVIHDVDWTYQYTAKFLGLDPTNNHRMLVSGLSYSPVAGDVVDLALYSPVATTDPKSKAFFMHICPSATVVTGVSTTELTVSSGDAAKLYASGTIRVHNADFTIDSGEVYILSVVGTTITTQMSLGFTPAASQRISLIGFADHGGPYRWL